MKQCNHPWLENSVVAQRALDMLPALKGYLKAIKDKRIRRHLLDNLDDKPVMRLKEPQ